MSGVKLLPLRCPGCGGALRGESSAAFLYCPGCGAGHVVAEDGSLVAMSVSFAAYDASRTRFYPFWTFTARLALRSREGGSPRGLSALFAQRGAIRFYCAAYSGDFEAKARWSLHLTREQPELSAASRQPSIEGLVFTPDEARKIAEDVFLESEIELGDIVRNLAYSLDLGDPRLVVIAL
jgi:hypothetical protein